MSYFYASIKLAAVRGFIHLLQFAVNPVIKCPHCLQFNADVPLLLIHISTLNINQTAQTLDVLLRFNSIFPVAAAIF